MSSQQPAQESTVVDHGRAHAPYLHAVAEALRSRGVPVAGVGTDVFPA